MHFGDEQVPEVVWAKMSPEPNTGCWIWTAALQSTGRPVMRTNGVARYVSRVMHEAANGTLADGLDLRQRCGLLSCVNPEHYEAMTRRALNRAKFSAPVKRCKNGHEFTPENTYVRHGGGRICRACHATRKKLSEKAKKWRRDNGLRYRLWRRFGLTVEQYEAMLEAQEHRCAICRVEFGDGGATPHVDHCHLTLRVRGLLCMLCNNALGALRDDPERALRAAEYLTCNHNAQETA